MARNRLTSTQRIQAAENIYDRDVLSSVLQADIENLRQISMDEDRDTFQTAVEKIVHARHIYILGARSSTHLAGYLYFYMQMIFENVTLVQASAAGEIFEQLFRSGEGDVMIAFSFPRVLQGHHQRGPLCPVPWSGDHRHHGSEAVSGGPAVQCGAAGPQRDAVLYRFHDGTHVAHQCPAGGDRHQDGHGCDEDLYHAGTAVGSVRCIRRCGR